MLPFLRNYLQNWKCFVDDTFVFALPEKNRYKVNQLNTFDKNIQFLYEMGEDNTLAFLDVMVTRNTDKTINTKVY